MEKKQLKTCKEWPYFSVELLQGKVIILYRYGQMLSYIDNNSIEYADRNILHTVHGVDICACTCKFNPTILELD